MYTQVLIRDKGTPVSTVIPVMVVVVFGDWSHSLGYPETCCKGSNGTILPQFPKCWLGSRACASTPGFGISFSVCPDFSTESVFSMSFSDTRRSHCLAGSSPSPGLV